MKNKKKKPKDKMIRLMVDDLKKEPVDSSASIGLLKSPGDDKTTLINAQYNTTTNANEFYVSGSEKETNFKKLLDITNSVLPTEILAGLQTNTGAQSPADDSLTVVDSEKTLISPAANIPQARPAPANLNSKPNYPSSEATSTKVAYGGGRSAGSPFENPFIQAETLKLAQQRILQLEREVESLRKENEILSSAGEITKQKHEDLIAKVQNLEKQKHELKEVNESELEIFKDGLNAKEAEIRRLKIKIEELESRLANDLRRIRVRERELENRLELSKSEKVTLLRAKDEVILELKRRMDQSQGEMDGYQNKVLELQQTLELNQEQFARTVRALRIALTNLEVNDSINTSITIAPLKKAE
jgi:DNA-binding XRE family transcriptional regulator